MWDAFSNITNIFRLCLELYSMETGRYHIYEILDNGNIRKVSLNDFTREEAEKSIIKSMHPMDRKRVIAIKVQAVSTAKT